MKLPMTPLEKLARRAACVATAILVIACGGVVTIVLMALAVIAWHEGTAQAALAFAVAGAVIAGLSADCARLCFLAANSTK